MVHWSAAMNQVEQRQIEEARVLAAKLERLSADSYWAHQASGLRGALLRLIEAKSSPGANGETPPGQLDFVLAKAFEILVRAAREMHP